MKFETNLGSYSSLESTNSESSELMDQNISINMDGTLRMSISWENLTVKPPLPTLPWYKSSKTHVLMPTTPILHKLNGVVEAGSICAIMGTSGSGKTVFLNTLANRNTGNLEISGRVRVNGCVIGSEMSSFAALVQQIDAFRGTLTVQEHLNFQTQLRLSEKYSDAEKSALIDDVLSEVGLSHRKDTPIGITGMVKTLSGGEKRRLLFASEIITNPKILFCDEPTSGLDAFMAKSVIEILKKMAEKGRTVLCVIHQPPSEVYNLFDKIMLIANGETAFLGTRKEAVKYFDSLGYTCPQNFNPADHFIDLIALKYGTEQEDYAQIQKICDAYKISSYAQNHLKEIANMESECETNSCSLQSEYSQKTKRCQRTWWIQFKLQFWRLLMEQIRDPNIMKAYIISLLITALVIGLIYINQDYPYSQAGEQNINGAIVMILFGTPFACLMANISVMSKDKYKFIREYEDRMYSCSSYYLANVLVQIPTHVIIFPIISMSIIYYMVGMYPNVYTFLAMNGILIAVNLCNMGIAQCTSIIAWDAELSMTLLPFIRNILTIFSGYFVTVTSIIVILKPFVYTSSFFWAFQLMLIYQWKDVDYLTCEYAEYTDNKNFTSSFRCFSSGEQIIRSYGFELENASLCWIVLPLYFIVTEVMGFTIFKWKCRKLT